MNTYKLTALVMMAFVAACGGVPTEEGGDEPDYVLSCFQNDGQGNDRQVDELLVGETLGISARGYLGPVDREYFDNYFPSWVLSPAIGTLNPGATVWSRTTNPVATTTFTATRAGTAHLTIPCRAVSYFGCPAARCRITVYDKQILTVQVTGSGTVTSLDGGINCTSSCSKAYRQGQTVQLTAKPGPNQRFEAWGGACQGQMSLTAQVKLDSDKNCTATFKPTVTPVSITLSNGGKAAAPLQKVTLTANKDPGSHCFQWYIGADTDKTRLEVSSKSMTVRVTGNQTYHLVVLDKPCSVELGRARADLKMLAADLPLTVWQSRTHVAPNEQVSFRALAYQGSQKVLATQVHSAAETLWMVVRDKTVNALQTDNSGAELRLAMPGAGNYWVHFMLKDTAGKYGLRSALLQVK